MYALFHFEAFSVPLFLLSRTGLFLALHNPVGEAKQQYSVWSASLTIYRAVSFRDLFGTTLQPHRTVLLSCCHSSQLVKQYSNARMVNTLTMHSRIHVEASSAPLFCLVELTSFLRYVFPVGEAMQQYPDGQHRSPYTRVSHFEASSIPIFCLDHTGLFLPATLPSW